MQTTQAQRERGWPTETELDEWLAVLHPALVAEANATDADRALASWVRKVAQAAARELLLAENGRGR